MLWELAIATGQPRSEFETAEDVYTAIEIMEKRNGGSER
jgi:hypothetical protein